MLCMTFFFCAPLQSAGGFILEEDWTPTKTNLLYSPPIEVGVLSTFKIKWIVGIDKLSYNIFVHIEMGLNRL